MQSQDDPTPNAKAASGGKRVSRERASGPLWSDLPPVSLLYKVSMEADQLTESERKEWEGYVKRSQEAEKRRDRLGLIDLAEVMEEGVTEPEMLVPDLLVKADHHLVYGTKESSKTWIVLNAAVGLIKEGETVFWVDKEMGRRNIADRLVTLGADPDSVRDHFVYLEFPSMDASDESKLLWETLLRTKEPALVAFDAQTELLADAGLNENVGTDIEKWSQPYITPCRRVGATTVMIDHTGHSEGGRAVASRQKGAAAKIELSVVKDEKFGRDKVGRVSVEVTKNTVSAPIPEKQSFRIGGTDSGFVLERSADTTDPKAEKQAEVEQRIEREIEERLAKGPLNQTQLTHLVTGAKQTVLKVAKRMANSDMSRVELKPEGRSVLYSLESD